MSPEETARFHADRPGNELIDYAEVCLPIFKIYMVASLLQHIDISETARIFGKERSEGRRDLLAIKMIERRMRLQLPVTALVLRPIEGGEVELLFASDTQLLDEHNRAFALAEGQRCH